jgi:hypothetical protein
MWNNSKLALNLTVLMRDVHSGGAMPYCGKILSSRIDRPPSVTMNELKQHTSIHMALMRNVHSGGAMLHCGKILSSRIDRPPSVTMNEFKRSHLRLLMRGEASF